MHLPAAVQVERPGRAHDRGQQGRPAAGARRAARSRARSGRPRRTSHADGRLAPRHADEQAGEPHGVVVVAVGDARRHDLDAALAQPLAVEVDGDQPVGLHPAPVGHDHGVDDARPDVLHEPVDVQRDVVADRLVALLEQVGHVHAARRRGQHRGAQLGHQQRRQRRGEQRARAEHQQVGALHGLHGLRQRRRRLGLQAQAAHVAAVAGDRGLAGHDAPVLHLRHQGGRRGGRRQHLAGDGQHAGAERDGGVERPDDLRQRGQEQVAEGVAGDLALREPVLEDGGQQGLVLGQGHQAVADVARRRQVEVAAQAAGGAAVVGQRDDGHGLDAGDLEAAQDDREAGSAAEADDPRRPHSRTPSSRSRRRFFPGPLEP